jgi:hypothetical protein
MLAMLHIQLGSRATSMLPKHVPTLIILVGLFISSFPQEHPEWAPWSRSMFHVGLKVTPEKVELNRYWVSIGISTLMIGIFFSRNGRRVLTSPLFNFLGRVSFPVYLLHDTFIRSVLTWMVYGPAARAGLDAKDANGKPQNLKPEGKVAFIVAIPCFYALLYWVTYQWTLYVDPWCGKLIQRMKTVMFVEEEQSGREKTALLTSVS